MKRPRKNLAEGEALKSDALELLERKHPSLTDRIRAALLQTGLDSPTGETTVDDARTFIVEWPADANLKTFGSAPGKLADDGLIRRKGFKKTDRPEAHARFISVWEIADRDAAEAWLAAHRAKYQTTNDAAAAGPLFEGSGV